MKAHMVLTEFLLGIKDAIELRGRCCHELLIDIEKNLNHTQRHSIASGSWLKQ